MKPEIRGLLFDKDGTLFDFQTTWGNWSANEMKRLSKGDAALAERLASAIGLRLSDGCFEPDSFVIAGTADQVVSALLPHLPHYSFESLSDELEESTANAPQNEVVPLKPLFAKFKAAGLVLGISTNDAETAARGNLRSCDVEEDFRFIAGYDSGFGGKPAPGMQKAFCEITGLEPAEVAMVGDSTHDLIAGEAAGMLRIAVLTGVAGHDELAPYADHVLQDIGEIPALLGIS